MEKGKEENRGYFFLTEMSLEWPSQNAWAAPRKKGEGKGGKYFEKKSTLVRRRRRRTEKEKQENIMEKEKILWTDEWTDRHQRLYKALVKRSSRPKKDPEEEETIEEPVLFLLFS